MDRQGRQTLQGDNKSPLARQGVVYIYIPLEKVNQHLMQDMKRKMFLGEKKDLCKNVFWVFFFFFFGSFLLKIFRNHMFRFSGRGCPWAHHTRQSQL